MTEPTDAELDAVLYKHWPAFSMQATLVRMWVRAAMRAAIVKWGTPPAEQAAPKAAPAERVGTIALIGNGSTTLTAAIAPVLAAPQQEAQEPIATQWLAEMIMSDCGCSTQNQRLLDRIVERITQYDAANTAPQPAPAPLSDDVAKDAMRFRELYRMTALLVTPAGNAYQDAMQSEMAVAFEEAGRDLTKISIEQYRRVVDAGFAAAALAAQGGKDAG